MGKRRGKRRGQSMVELALVLPILLLIVLGLIEFGRAFFIYTVVSNAAREGARFGIIEPANAEGIQSAAESRLILVAPEAVSITVSYDDGDGAGEYFDPLLISPGQSRVRVNVSYEFSMITPIIRGIFPPTEIRFLSARTVSVGARVRK